MLRVRKVSLGALLLVLALTGMAAAQAGGVYPYAAEPDRVIDNDVIVVMSSTDFDPSIPAGAYLHEVTRLYERYNPNVTVELNWGSWGDLWQKVGVMLGARQGPDLVIGTRDYLFAPGRGFGQWADILTIPEHYFSETDVRAMGPAVLESVRFPGREGYMLWPWKLYVDGTMVVNGDMLREAGYDPVQIQQNGWTIEQFLDVARKVTKDTTGDGRADQWAALFGPLGGHNGERIGQLIVDSRANPLHLKPSLAPNFFDISTGEFWFEEDVWAESWQFVIDMIDEGLIPANSVGIDMSESRLAFVEGKTAFSFDGPDLLTEIEEHNRAVQDGRKRGVVIDAYAVPRPHRTGRGYGPIRPTVITHGFYSFKQEPYKGDAHTRNVFDYARFLTSAPFQPILAVNNFMPPDMRVYVGEHAFFPGLMGTGPNVDFMTRVREMWLPTFNVYINLATTSEVQDALVAFQREVFVPTRDAVFLRRMTPQEGAAHIAQKLRELSAQIPKERRMSPDAAVIVRELEQVARNLGVR